MRGIERIFGIARQTLARWLKEKAAILPDLAETLEPPQAGDVLELDELWSFVLKKSEKCSGQQHVEMIMSIKKSSDVRFSIKNAS